MNNIGLYLKEPVKKKTNPRQEMIKEIYAIYTSPHQKMNRKIMNWKKYFEWCKENKIPKGKEGEQKFKKSKFFIKEHPIKTFCFFMAPIPTADLTYIISVAKDMENRQQNFSGYLMANLLNKTKQL